MKQKTTSNPGYVPPVISVIEINGIYVICGSKEKSGDTTDSEAKTYMY